MAQFPPELHVYPNGQQLEPHVDKVPVSAVVFKELSEFCVLF